MAESIFEARLEAMKSRIAPLERIVAAFAGSLPQPFFYDSAQKHYGFRFGTPGIRHFCLLKAVRVVSALNAATALARNGYSQEIGVLVRTLIECTTHIEFVLDGVDDTGALAPDVEKYVQDYFADFARNSSADFRRAQVKQNIVHKRLGATLDNISQQGEGTKPRPAAEKLYSNIYLTYSNYVHAKYPEVMDLYGGLPGRFHLDGMRGTPKDDENLQIISTFIDTASITLQLIVSRFRLHRLLESDVTLANWFRS
jgi:hypothetical protein